MPDAVPPPPQDDAADIPVAFVAIPALSKVELDPVMPVVEVPVLVHASVLAAGSAAIGLTPPGKSSVAPSGMPAAPADEVVPGTPSGEVAPIAGDVGISGAV